MTPADDLGQQPDLLELRTVSDPQALKAIADPLRLQMLQLLSNDPQRLWTVKELAARLGEPTTKLYHHMKLLASAELVLDVETRVVSGIVEHRYRCAQRAIKLDDALFGSPTMRGESVKSLVGVLDQTRDDFVAYASGADADIDRISFGRALLRLTDDDHAELMKRMEQLIEEFGARSKKQRKAIRRSAITVVMHPMNEPTD